MSATALKSAPVDTVTAKAGKDVVFAFSYITLDGAARRGWFMPEDRFVQSLLADERVRGLLIADTVRRAPAGLTRIIKRREPAASTSVLQDFTEVMQPFRLQPRPKSLRAIERLYSRYCRSMQRAAAKMGLEEPAVITVNPLVAGFADLSWARAVTYYAVDDWTQLDGYRRWRPAYREAYARIRGRGFRVGAVTADLRDRLTASDASVIVPNGLDPSEWEGQATPPSFARGSDRPILVYAGTL